jgi:hypothetical protein
METRVNIVLPSSSSSPGEFSVKILYVFLVSPKLDVIK